jgi:hypothetical protein
VGAADALGDPPAVLPAGNTWDWRPGDASFWRAYHRDDHTPYAAFRRTHGPIARFDHHVSDPPGPDPDERSVIYLARNLETALAEAFRNREIGAVCPRWRIAQLKTDASVKAQDIAGGGAMKIGALPELSTGAVSRAKSQRWARAIHATGRVRGILYAGAHDLGEALVLWETAPALILVTDDGVDQDFAIIRPGIWGRCRRDLHDAVGMHLRKVASSECEKCLELGLA